MPVNFKLGTLQSHLFSPIWLQDVLVHFSTLAAARLPLDTGHTVLCDVRQDLGPVIVYERKYEMLH